MDRSLISNSPKQVITNSSNDLSSRASLDRASEGPVEGMRNEFPVPAELN